MNRGHHGLFDAEVVFEYLHHWGDTVGSTGGVGENLVAWSNRIFVYANHNRLRALALSWSRKHDLLRTGGDMSTGFHRVGEEASGFNHYIHTELPPRELSRLFLCVNWNRSIVNDNMIFIITDAMSISTIVRIVFQENSKRLGIGQIVNGNNLDIVTLKCDLKCVAANPSETVNCYFYHAASY